MLIGLSGIHPMTTTAQKLEFNGEFLLFREAKTKQPVLIVNDSLVYKGNAMKRIPFKHTEYPAKLQEYTFFNIGAKTYLVHDGCGPVLEFRNDSIVRIDNSFLHRNQFGAAKFVYNNEIYFFGGYGLFTFKNILTKFDFQTGEWIEIRTYSDVPMETRAGGFSYIFNNDLYIFGGDQKDKKNVLKRKKLDNSVWRLYLPTMQWSNCGEVNGVANLDYLKVESINENQEKIYLITSEFNIINPIKNTLEKFELKFNTTIFSNYLEGDTIICVSLNNLNQSKYFSLFPIDNLKGKPLTKSIFVKAIPFTINKSYIIILIIIISVLLIIFRKKIISKLNPFDGILYNQQTNQFSYKNKTITIFVEQEKRLLMYLLKQNNLFVSLNELNQLFENNGNTETISAIVKRREQAVSGLLTKVSKLTGIEEKELIVERKNSKDKRIKDLKLLPNLLKLKY